MSITNDNQEEQIKNSNKFNAESQNEEVGLERSESEILRIKHEQEMNFNKALDLMYKAKKSHQGFNMNDKDLNFVIEQLNPLKFFSDIKEKCKIKAFSQLCLEHLNIEIFTEGSILFHKGDNIDRIHIVADGQVVVYSDKSSKELLQDQVNFKKNKQKNASVYDKIFLKKNIRKLEYIQQGVLTVKNTNKFRVGDYFGDSRCPPGQTIQQQKVYLASSHLKVITIYKDIFYNLIDLALDEKSKKKLCFFKELLPTSPLLNLVQLIHYIKEKFYKYKEFIYQENEPSPKFLYVINEGEVTIQIHPSEELKKQYKNRIELAILSKFEVFGDESLLGINRRTDAQCRTKLGVSVYYFKSKDLKKQSDLNENILKLLERNSKLKSEFQQNQLVQIKMMNKEMEKQNEQILKKKESIIEQIINEITVNQKKVNKNLGLYVDQNIVEQTYDVIPKSLEEQKYFNRKNVFTSHDSKQKQSTIDIDFQKRTRLFSSISQRQNVLNNSSENTLSIKSSLNNKIYNVNQSQNGGLLLDGENNYQTLQMATENTRNDSQIFKKHLFQNSQAALNTNSVAQIVDKNQQQNTSLFVKGLHRRKSQSVFISHGLTDSIFQNENDEEVLNNFSSIEKMRNVKILNFNKLCDTQRINNQKEKSISPKNSQLDIQKDEQKIVKSQKNLIVNTLSSQPKFSKSPSRKSSVSPLMTNQNQQIQQQQQQQQINAQNQSYQSSQKHTKYPFVIHTQHIYDKMRIEDQSIEVTNSIQTSRTENQQRVIKQRYIKSQTSGQRSNESPVYHHQIISANQSPTNISFRQKNDKNFSNIKNSFFTKKQQNKLKNLIFFGDNPQNQEEGNQKNKQLANISKQSYQLDSNDLPLLNLYRIQHKQSIKYHSEQKSQSTQPKKRIQNINFIKKIDKEDKFLPTFYLDYSLM